MSYTGSEVVCGLLCIIGGLLLTTFGLRLHRPSFLFAGFFWGFWVTFFVARAIDPAYSTDKPGVLFAIFVVFALLVGLLAAFVNFVGILLLASTSGVLIGAYILSFVDPASNIRVDFYRWIVMGCMALLAILFAFGLGKLKRYVVGAQSAIVGAFVTFVGIDFFSRTGFNSTLEDVLQGLKTQPLETQLIGFLVALGLTMVLGSVVQIKTGASVDLEIKKKKNNYYSTIVNL